MPVLIAASFCFASFGWGMARHFRRIGPPSRGMIVVGVLALLSAILHLTALTLRPLWLPIPAVAFYVCGAGMFWWAAALTRRKLAACGQGCVSAGIVCTGPYRFIRHPFYSAYNLAWLAGFVATGWWPVGAAAIAMAFLYERAAREEERGFMEGPLADEYRRYSRRAGRYLPRVISTR